MPQMNPREMQQALAKPFAPEDLEWRLQQAYEDKMRGMAVPYVTNRAIQNRLDEVCGPENWYNDFKPWHSNGKKESQLCGIAIHFEGRGFITKWDGAEDSDIEPVKGGLSDSMKRAAYQWGIGRVLYSLDTVWVDIEQHGSSFVIKDSERARLDNAYLSALQRLGLQPAAASGIQSLLTPKAVPEQKTGQNEAPAPAPRQEQPGVQGGGQQRAANAQQARRQQGQAPNSQQPAQQGQGQRSPKSAQQGQAPRGQQPGQPNQPPRGEHPGQQPGRAAPAPQQSSGSAPHQENRGGKTMPFGNPRQEPQNMPELFTVLDAKVQGGMSGSSTLVQLETPQKKQIYAYVRGVRQELARGVQLCNVKLNTHKQDTVVFYVLEAYEIYQQPRQAA